MEPVLIEVSNDYHNTRALVREGRLSPVVVYRVRRTLCGVDGCHCGGNLSERGKQAEWWEYTPDDDGGGWIELVKQEE